MNVKAELVKRISKDGKEYIAIEVTITENVKKLVFLTAAELELLKLTSNQK